MVGTFIRRFGVPTGAPGVVVEERSGINALSEPQYGTMTLLGVLKRGPMGVPIPVSHGSEYDEIFGDPSDSTWHLYSDNSHLTPDAIDGFYSAGGGAGRLWLIRLGLEGKARKSSVTVKSRTGFPVIRFDAANEGRWGGRANQIDWTPVVFATSKTFTLNAPGVLSNEFLGAEVEFSGVAGEKYAIVSNTEANGAGDVIFTVGSQFDLINDGVAGPVALSGSTSYARYRTLAGSVNFPLQANLTGTVSISGLVITGTGTAFSSELHVGAKVYVNSEIRTINSITSNTTATVSNPFTTTASGITISTDNLTITGTSTTFTADIAVGDTIYANIGGSQEGRTVLEITSDTSLVLSSGFTEELPLGSTLQADNLTVLGAGTLFTTEVNVGESIIDPNREGAVAIVAAIPSDNELTLETPFSRNWSDAQLAKQTQSAVVELKPSFEQEGLSVVLGQGIRYPATHFSLQVLFNGSEVMPLINDVSLDPDDPQGLFVEDVLNSANIAYQTGTQNYQKYISCEVLWQSAYTTASTNDLRPASGAGKVLAVETSTLYTVSDLVDYDAAVGNRLFPDPYDRPRSSFFCRQAIAPFTLTGTLNSVGTTVNGTSTLFLSELEVGDYLYDPNTDSARKVVSISSDTVLSVESGFDANLPALTVGQRAGSLSVEQGYDITGETAIGSRFFASYPIYLEGGYDDDTSNVLPYHYTVYADAERNIIEDATLGRNQGLIRIATPGISDVAIQKAFAAYAEQKAYEYRAEIPSFYNTAAAAEAFVQNELGRNDFITVAFPSYGFIANPLGAGDRYISLSGDIMGGESRQAVTVKGYFDPFAGVQATLARILKLPLEARPNDTAIINVSGLQTIKTEYGNVVVWGGRAPSISPTYDFIHIRRTQSHYVRIFVEARAFKATLFRPNGPGLANQLRMTLDNFFLGEYQKGAINRNLTYEQAVTISTGVENSGVVNDRAGLAAVVENINGETYASVEYMPNGINEVLTLRLGPQILASFSGT